MDGLKSLLFANAINMAIKMIEGQARRAKLQRLVEKNEGAKVGEVGADVLSQLVDTAVANPAGRFSESVEINGQQVKLEGAIADNKSMTINLGMVKFWKHGYHARARISRSGSELSYTMEFDAPNSEKWPFAQVVRSVPGIGCNPYDNEAPFQPPVDGKIDVEGWADIGPAGDSGVEEAEGSEDADSMSPDSHIFFVADCLNIPHKISQDFDPDISIGNMDPDAVNEFIDAITRHRYYVCECGEEPVISSDSGSGFTIYVPSGVTVYNWDIEPVITEGTHDWPLEGAFFTFYGNGAKLIDQLYAPLEPVDDDPAGGSFCEDNPVCG